LLYSYRTIYKSNYRTLKLSKENRMIKLHLRAQNIYKDLLIGYLSLSQI